MPTDRPRTRSRSCRSAASAGRAGPLDDVVGVVEEGAHRVLDLVSVTSTMRARPARIEASASGTGVRQAIPSAIVVVTSCDTSAPR